MKLSNKGSDDTKFIVKQAPVTPWDYSYGFGQPKLSPESIRTKSWWVNSAIWSFSFNSTGNVSVTWLWFTPKSVQFYFCDAGGTWYGQGWMTNTAQFAFDIINSKSQITTQCIYIRNGSGTAIGRAVYVSMDSDWFTINVTVAWATINVSWIAQG